MINPYLCYVLGFVVSLLAYQLGWSEIYPSLSSSLLIFLSVTMVAHTVLSKFWTTTERKIRHRGEAQSTHKINPWGFTIFLYLLWAIDFVHEGGVPLFKMLLGIPFDYKKFGFPVLHVLAVSLSSFYSVYLFSSFLKSKNKETLLLFAINMLAALLIISRAMLFFNLASCTFLYLLRLEKIPFKKLLLSLPLIILLLFLFGVAGTKRVSFESKSQYNHELFLDNGKATRQFRESWIPKEFFWSYFYISSPLANLQVNINTYQVKPITIKRFFEYINNELVFESISKRINSLVGIEREDESVVKYPFNVSTMYSRSYSYLGWIGMIIMAIVVLGIPIWYSQLLVNNPYRLVGVAIMCSAFLFMSYDNTIRLMGMGFQLVYPVLFPIFEKQLAYLLKRAQ